MDWKIPIAILGTVVFIFLILALIPEYPETEQNTTRQFDLSKYQRLSNDYLNCLEYATDIAACEGYLTQMKKEIPETSDLVDILRDIGEGVIEVKKLRNLLENSEIEKLENDLDNLLETVQNESEEDTMGVVAAVILSRYTTLRNWLIDVRNTAREMTDNARDLSDRYRNDIIKLRESPLCDVSPEECSELESNLRTLEDFFKDISYTMEDVKRNSEEAIELLDGLKELFDFCEKNPEECNVDFSIETALNFREKFSNTLDPIVDLMEKYKDILYSE